MASALQEKKGASDYQDQKQFVSELFTSSEGASLFITIAVAVALRVND